MADRTIVLHAKTTHDGRGMLEAAREMERTADGVDKLGGKMRLTSEHSKRLGKQIEETAKKVGDLRHQIAATGDESLFGDLAKQERSLRRLQKLASDLTPRSGGGNFLSGIPRIGGVPGPAIAGGVGAAAVLSPAIGATIAAAVLGGTGTGGLIGGIALAAQDTRVKSAFKDVGKEMFEGLGDSASSFVEPLIGAASKFGDAWRKEAPAFRENFAILSDAVDPLTEGVIGFVHNLGPGLKSAFTASIPLAEQFGEELEHAGEVGSDFLEEMARSGPGAKAALHDLFVVTDMFVDRLGDGIRILSQTYDGLNRIGGLEVGKFLVETPGLVFAISDVVDHFMLPALDKSVKSLKGAADATGGLNRQLQDQADAARENADAIERNTRAIKDYFDTIDNQQDSAERYQRSLLDLRESVDENGVSLAINTREGLANRDALQEAARATRDMHEAGLLTDEAYRQQIVSLEKLAVKLGFNKDQVLALIGALEKTPKQILTEVGVKFTGAAAAFADFLKWGQGGRNVSAGQQGRGGTDFSTVPVQGTLSRQAFIEGTRDSGGSVMPGKSYLIGGRPEVLTMGSMGGHVTPIGGGAQVVLRAGGGGNQAFEALVRALIPYLTAEVQHLGSSGEVLGIR